MKKRFSKKFLVPIIAGALVLSIALAGSYAWYTQSVDTGDSTFVSGKIDFQLTDSNCALYSFDGTVSAAHPYQPQQFLESEFKMVVDGSILAQHPTYLSNQTTFNQVMHDVLTFDPADPAADPFLIACNLPLTMSMLAPDTTGLFTPGGFLINNFTYTNNSTIPVYYRVNFNNIGIWDVATNQAVTDAVVGYFVVDGSGNYVQMVPAQDGYWYCLTPIESPVTSGNDSLGIRVGAYFPGCLNDGANMPQDDTYRISFSPDGSTDSAIDFIQATNNAASLSWNPKGLDGQPLVFVAP